MSRAFSIVKLGAFDVDVHTGELSRAGRRIHLPVQSARLLLLLVERAPAVVTRDEIRAALWDGDTHVEFEAAINTCISHIRAALGDSARSPRFIETVPRLGYRCLGVRSHTEPPVAPPEKPATPISRRWQPVAATAVFAVVIALVAASTAKPSRSTMPRSLAVMQKFERGISGLADAAPRELIDRVRYFETAIAADPQFAAAYAGLAEAKLLIGTYRAEPASIAYAAAKAAAQQALALDPLLAEAHAAFGAASLLFEWNWEAARRHLRHAAALDSRSLSVQLWLSRYLSAAGEHDRAIAAAMRAVDLAPGSPAAVTALGVTQFYDRQYGQARATCERALQMMREFVPARTCRDAAEAGAARSPNPILLPVVEIVHSGERERAFDWLQRAANRRSDSLIYAGVEPGFEVLRDDPRFTGVLTRVGSLHFQD